MGAAMPAGLEFEQATRAAKEWLDDLMARLDWHDQHRTCAALAAALHALRDALPHDATIDVGNLLPILVRGLYYDGWHPRGRDTAHTRSAFLERIHDGVHRDPAIDADAVARAVLALLAARLPAAEIEDAKAATPHELHNLWPT